MSIRRRKFSDEFKREAVRMAYGTERSIADVGRELDVRADLIRRWRKDFGKEAAEVAKPDLEQENRRLRKELGRVNQDRAILKKALAIFSEDQP